MSYAVGNTEILQIADAVGREKNIPKDVILEAMEGSMAIAARKKYGHDRNVKAKINRDNGEISIFREIEVVEDGYVYEALPPIDLGRVAAQTAKQVIIQKVREAERERQYNDYQPRVGEIINGVVKRVEFGHVIVDLGNAEAVIERNEQIRGEVFKVNDRVRAYLKDVRRENKGAQIFLSRTAPEFMAKLFAQEVPEIYDNIIEVKSVAREPGSRAKIAVSSSDSNIDPVGSCVGIRGSRVQAVINELQGEKIDIVQWSADPATFLVNAISPSEVSKVVIDEDKRRVEVVVPDDQLSLAIGRRGQNVRLASELIGWNIDVMTDEEESKRRSEEFETLSVLFVDALNIEEIIAHLLVSEGFSSIEEIAFVATTELASIEGFNEDVAAELQARAKEYLDQKKQDVESAMKKLGITEDLQGFAGLSDAIKVSLGENGIKTLDDFADLSHDEFVEIIPESGLSNEEVDELIMSARAHWFEDEGADEAAEGKEAV
jgi:N utilization substance protein A